MPGILSAVWSKERSQNPFISDRSMLWNLCLRRVSLIQLSRRTLATNATLDTVIQRLSNNYKTELTQLQKNENETSMERIKYLQSTLKSMTLREKVLQDFQETNKLSHGK